MFTEMAVEKATDGTDVWRLPTVAGGTLLVVTDEASYTLPLPPDQLDRIADQIVLEGVPAEVRLSNALKIPHGKVIAVHGEEKGVKITVAYHSLKAAFTTHGVSNHEMVGYSVHPRRLTQYIRIGR